MIRPIDLRYPRSQFDTYDALYNQWKCLLLGALEGSAVIVSVEKADPITVLRLIGDMRESGWDVTLTTTIRPEINTDNGKRPAAEVPAVRIAPAP